MRLIYVNEIGSDYKGQKQYVQNSDYFGVIDAVDGIIAMAWEKSNFDMEDDRLFFRFGESYEKVTDKLKSRDLKLEKQDLKFKIS
jgi:hypothetical protein